MSLIPKEKLVDVMNRPLTVGLFFENVNNDFAVYTLKEYDLVVGDVTYPSLKKLYLECEDPTEYSFIQRHLYNIKQWERMCANAFLAPFIQEWREELDLKLTSSAIQGILEIATDEMASGQLQALKFFAKEEYKKQAKASVGRPKREKEEAKDELDYGKEIFDLQKKLKRVK